MTTNEFRLQPFLGGEHAAMLWGCTPTDRDLELIRLGSVVPAGSHGYLTQLRDGSRAVKLDAARQLERAGVRWNVSVPTE